MYVCVRHRLRHVVTSLGATPRAPPACVRMRFPVTRAWVYGCERVPADVRVRPAAGVCVSCVRHPVTRERPPPTCDIHSRACVRCACLSCTYVCKYHPDCPMSSSRRQNRYQCEILHTCPKHPCESGVYGVIMVHRRTGWSQVLPNSPPRLDCTMG